MVELNAQTLFYPVAGLYAALVLPLSVPWMPQWHAHEMLFGYALAVVAGNQLGPARGRQVVALVVLWASARLLFLLFPATWTSALANGAFAAALAIQVAPRLFRSAKKWRNQALPAILVGLCLAAAAFHIRTAVLLFAALMLFMGGRILAPAVAGQLQRQGVTLGPRVQPRLEGALIVAMALALLWTPACTAAGVLAAVRMLRWRLWALRERADLFCLAAGYAWLAAGLVAFGIAQTTSLMHLITVGALGTLTFNVMAFSWLLRARRDAARQPLIPAGTALLALATVFRLMEGSWLTAAALCWTLAFAILLLLFSRSRAAPPN